MASYSEEESASILPSGESRERWRYVVLVSKFSLDFLTHGLLKAFGVLVPPLVYKLQTDFGAIGFILAMELTLFFMASPVVCLLTKGINPRVLCFVGSFGSSAALFASAFTDSAIWFGATMFLTGLLSSPMNQVAHEILHEYFGERFGYINSICLLGGLIGGMVWPVITSLFLQAYGLEGALVCLAAIYLNCAPLAVIFRPPRSCPEGFDRASLCEVSGIKGDTETYEDASPGHIDFNFENIENQATRDTQSTATNVKNGATTPTKFEAVVNFFCVTLNIGTLLEERAFSFLFLPCKYILQVVMVSWTLFVVSYAVTKGLDEPRADYLPIAGALGGFINQGLVTIILNYRPHCGDIIFAVDVASLAASLFLYQLSVTYTHLLICSFFAGSGIFGAFPATYSVLVSYVDKENFAAMLSFKFFVTGVAVVSSGYMAGSLYDVTGSFDDVFMTLGGLSVASVVLTGLLMVVKRHD